MNVWLTISGYLGYVHYFPSTEQYRQNVSYWCTFRKISGPNTVILFKLSWRKLPAFKPFLNVALNKFQQTKSHKKFVKNPYTKWLTIKLYKSSEYQLAKLKVQ